MKKNIHAIQSPSMRGLIDRINNWNSQCESSEDMILKEDIVTIMKENEVFLLIYYSKD